MSTDDDRDAVFQAVVRPLRERLEAAGFTTVHFERIYEINGEKLNAPMIVLRVGRGNWHGVWPLTAQSVQEAHIFDFLVSHMEYRYHHDSGV